MGQMVQTGIQEPVKESTPITAEVGISYNTVECMQLRTDHIEAYWGQLEGLLTEWAEGISGEFTVADIKKYLQTGVMSALLLHTAGEIKLVAIMEFIQYPQKKILRHVGFVGEKPALLSKFMPAIEAWAVANGAVELETWTTDHAKKLAERLGFKQVYSIMRKRLS